MKKLISLIITFWLIFCPFSRSLNILPVTVEGAVFGGNGTDKIPLTVKCDTKWLTKADNRIYNHKLASLAAVLCADSYFREKDVARGTPNRVVIDGETDEYNPTLLLQKLGWNDVRFVETFKEKSYSADTNDSATMVIGYKKVENKYDSYIVVLRGCFSIGERLSMFDIGSLSYDYLSLTGRHSEWKNKNIFKGLDISVNRAEEYIKNYMSEHDDPDCADTMLITGHSRGAALANVIGAHFERNKNVKSYTYTFNAMPVSKENYTDRYLTVFNVFDKNDYYVNPLPFGDEKFSRYGRNICVDISKSNSVQKQIASIKGRGDYLYLSPDIKAEYDRLFAERFKTCDSLYVMKTVSESFNSFDKASERKNEIASTVSGLSVSDFVKDIKLTDNGNGIYKVEFSYCSAALLYGFAQIQAYGQSACDAFISLFGDDTLACKIAEIIFDNLSSITGGHLIVNDFAVTDKIKLRLF